MTTPRIRTDLKATPLEEQGIKYFDVSDPRSGARMRLYDFEWLIAERMDGARRFDEVASWARERLGIQPTAEDLSEYARKLRELGFFEVDGVVEVEVEAEEDERTPLPEPMPAANDEPPVARANATAPTMMAQAPELPKAEPPPPAPPPPAPLRATEPERPAPERLPDPAALAQRDTATGKVEAAQPPRKSGGSGALIALVLVLLALAGAFVYMQYLRPQTVHVSVILATPREVVQLFDGAGKTTEAAPQVLTFGEAGKVADVVAKGTEAKPGMALATLDAYAQVEKTLADVKDRQAYYERMLAKAQAKKDAAGIAAAQAKVAEKKKLEAELEARSAKVRLVAPTSGTVTDVMVAVGDDAKPGAPVVKLGSKHLVVQLQVPVAQAPKVGDTVGLQPAGGGAILAGRVSASANGAVTIDLADGAGVNAGDSLRLVRRKEENVVPVPASAVVQRDGSDVVFVLSDGQAKLRQVTVVDRTDPKQVLISSGLATGDSVITSNADILVDGEKATTP